jgi:PTH1 family peptidyl-tRNA hydrolase
VLKPRTYMNLSGRALEALADLEPVRAGDTLVICDDIALPLGFVRLRKRGSDGGHNGLKSVIASLGGTGFPRLRLGVGPVPPGVDPADFVLDRMSADDAASAEKMLREALKCVETAVDLGFEAAMTRFNRRVGPDEGGESS